MSQTLNIEFVSRALDAETFRVKSLVGSERISCPYRYELELHSQSFDVDFDAILESTAVMRVRQPTADGARRVLETHGRVREIEYVKRKDEICVYRAVLVPRMDRLRHNHSSRIFMDKTTMEIVKEIFKEYGLDSSDNFEDKSSGGTKREYVVQYEETDMDFVHRWLAHEGIFYFFKQTENGEKIVFADATAAYQPVTEPVTVQHNPSQAERIENMQAADLPEHTNVIGWLSCKRVHHTSQVVMNDYNWRTPKAKLAATQAVVETDRSYTGDGTHYEYNAHYKTKEEGAALAKVRAEGVFCRSEVCTGISDHPGFHPASTFSLTEHDRQTLNGEYVIVSVEHHAAQDLVVSGSGMLTSNGRYRNTFSSIKSTVIWRPPLETGWPSIKGFMTAKIDAGGSGDYAEIDDMGRYKVKFPFDLSDREGGSASRYVRMAQPYAGGGMGMHFPLHKGTEVIVAFLDGDPDRPVIMGAVPNPDTASPVTGGNQSQCMIHTGGGNQLVIEDNDGSQSMKMYSPQGETSISIGLG